MRRDLAAWVAAATPAVVGAPIAGTPVGSSGLAGTLRAGAVLLCLNLSAWVAAWVAAAVLLRLNLSAWVAAASTSPFYLLSRK
ncbi:hypothetical protein E2562_017592 [Oryza meyeriana var. granulata]|uniref:Uncharacterized protein n=1 Tax=Oryza meyeriana var. granulata TaxID=110450 RepID=A0A6G1BLJ5_9ORYZ|nr:hypothetical protein E2562_017592 [Oryza meyeriana var. granulata]